MVQMARGFALVCASLAVGALLVTAAVGAPRTARQTEAQAEVHVLRIVAHSWSPRRMPGLVDPHTNLLANNTQALCRGRGRDVAGRYRRFLCLVRPVDHGPKQGLYVTYRVISRTRAEVHWLSYSRR